MKCNKCNKQFKQRKPSLWGKNALDRIYSTQPWQRDLDRQHMEDVAMCDSCLNHKTTKNEKRHNFTNRN